MKTNPATTDVQKIKLSPVLLEGLRSSPNMRAILYPNSALVFHVVLNSGEMIYGSIHESVEREKAARQVSEATLFAQKSLILATPRHIRVIRTDAIVRLDVYSDELFTSSNPKQGAVWEELTENDFHREAAIREESPSSRDTLTGKPGDVISVLARLDLANRESLFLSIDVTVPTVGEQRRFLTDLFDFPAFAFRRLDGGVGLINPAQINSCQFFPGARPPAQAWNVSITQLQPKK